uniref:Uncharacterized protein n=1 Tax=Glaucocystis incrassata TaxID=1789788 RepID=A0A3G1IVE5_9EUKA|nr:hypothetical protein [Glaucocystis incrassata]ASQ40017.1 hypothetical protein [Glaucocystis incrassata]
MVYTNSSIRTLYPKKYIWILFMCFFLGRFNNKPDFSFHSTVTNHPSIAFLNSPNWSIKKPLSPKNRRNTDSLLVYSQPVTKSIDFVDPENVRPIPTETCEKAFQYVKDHFHLKFKGVELGPIPKVQFVHENQQQEEKMKQLEYQSLAQQIVYWSEKTKSVINERKLARLRFEEEQHKSREERLQSKEEHLQRMKLNEEKHQKDIELIQAQIDSFKNRTGSLQ